MIEIKLPDLSRVSLEPGDVLIVRTERQISMHEARMIRERLREHFPLNDAAVLGPGVELIVIRPENGEQIVERVEKRDDVTTPREGDPHAQ